MSSRLVAQSGTFIIPSTIDKTIEEIMGLNDCLEEGLVKFVIDTKNLRHELLRMLYNMNITHATLFPDLDGLARSMALEFEFHWAYDPISGSRFNDFYEK